MCVGSERACEEVRGGSDGLRRSRARLVLPFSQHPPVILEVMQAQQHPWPALSLAAAGWFLLRLILPAKGAGDRMRSD